MSQNVTQSSIFSKPLELPNLFASYRIGDYPRAGLSCHPWKMTNTQAVLLNAFDLLANKRTRVFTSEIREMEGKLHEYIGFDGPLMLDSGAFNFQKQAEISIDPLDVLSIGIEFGVDASVVLDHPFLPNSEHTEIDARWTNTVENTRSMFEELKRLDGNLPDNFQLMPVLHGHDTETLKRALDDIVEIWGQEPTIVGIGSLAPLARNGSKQIVIDTICTVRQFLPNAHIHCFSMGSALLMLFAFYCGADTVDSQTWIVSAAFKYVQLPGFHLTRFSRRESKKDRIKYERTRSAFAQHLLQLIQEEEFNMKNWGTGKDRNIGNEKDALAYIDYLEDRGRKNHIHRRACHNLYTFNFEASRVRQEKKAGRLETFIDSRMKNTVYRKAFEYATEQAKSNP